MVQKSLGGSAGDFVLHHESLQKCLTYGQVTAPASGGDFAKTNMTAYPLLASNVLAKSGDEASVVAFVIYGEPISALGNGESTTGPLYTILNIFDGVVLNKNALPTNDAAATPAAFDKDAIETAIEAITPGAFARVEAEPTNTSTQTT
jgi:hypothetical protein